MKKLSFLILLIFLTNNFSNAQKYNLRQGLVAFYPFNGNAKDESGNSNHGRVYGARLTTDRNGNRNSAYLFNGQSDFISIFNPNSFPIGKDRNHTINAFFQLKSYSNVGYNHAIISYGQHSYRSRNIFLPKAGVSGKTTTAFYGCGFYGEDLMVNQMIVKLNTWYMITWTVDGNYSKLFLNGRLVGRKKIDFSKINTKMGKEYARIGRDTYGQKNYFNGKIDDLSIHNRVLSQQEIYLLYYGRLQADRTPPTISITSPNVYRGLTIVKSNRVTITGRAQDRSGISSVLVNGLKASLDANGNFSKTVDLAMGNNNFTVKAIDKYNNSIRKTFKINRQPKKKKIITNNDIDGLKIGKYYALIIGNNTYLDKDITSLDEPINDAMKLYNVLTNKYIFDPQNVTFIKNAGYVEMIEAFDDLRNKITPNDNLVVFYAGHGWWDDERDLGYWLPSDAKKNSTAFWIRNSTISDYMSSIKSKHTLLIADACFSGSIFKTRAAFDDAGQAIKSLYKLPSRSAMTSGNLKEVPDKSVFLKYLVQRLNENSEKYLSADELFVSFRKAVMNNSKTEPQFGTIQDAGDEGGEFIFIKN